MGLTQWAGPLWPIFFEDWAKKIKVQIELEPISLRAIRT